MYNTNFSSEELQCFGKFLMESVISIQTNEDICYEQKKYKCNILYTLKSCWHKGKTKDFWETKSQTESTDDFNHCHYKEMLYEYKISTGFLMTRI